MTKWHKYKPSSIEFSCLLVKSSIASCRNAWWSWHLGLVCLQLRLERKILLEVFGKHTRDDFALVHAGGRSGRLRTGRKWQNSFLLAFTGIAFTSIFYTMDRLYWSNHASEHRQLFWWIQTSIHASWKTDTKRSINEVVACYLQLVIMSSLLIKRRYDALTLGETSRCMLKRISSPKHSIGGRSHGHLESHPQLLLDCRSSLELNRSRPSKRR